MGCFTDGGSRPQLTVATTPEVGACEQTLEDVFSVQALTPPAERSGRYMPPSAARRTALHHALEAVDSQRWREAVDHAHDADYRVCRSGSLAMLTPRDVTSLEARVAIRIGEARPVAFEAPHPFHDRGTVEQARELFESTRARALIVSGAHRCENAGSTSGHPGHTKACGERLPYPVSDMAHATGTLFHQAHVSLFELYRDATFVSLHGMAQGGVSISNGTKLPLGSAEQPVARLAAELRRELPKERVTTCNAHAGMAPRYRLCGTTNVQGRHANGYPRSSVVEPLRASGRFVHIEQSRRVRRANDAMARAFLRWLES